jgi:hypothetical protein
MKALQINRRRNPERYFLVACNACITEQDLPEPLAYEQSTIVRFFGSGYASFVGII